MSAQLILPRAVSGNEALPENLQQSLESFQAIQSQTMRRVLWFLPRAITLYLFLTVLPVLLDPVLKYSWKDPRSGGVDNWCTSLQVERLLIGQHICIDAQYVSGLATAGLALLLFTLLMRWIPGLLHTLWARNLLGVKNSESANPVNFADEYLTFVRSFEKSLNHPTMQWIFGVGFAALGLSWRFIANYRDLIQVMAMEFLIGFVIGFMAWRVTIIGYRISILPSKFDILPNSFHPDGCGGLRPIGDLCLWNALILAIPTTLLAFWIILIPGSFQYVEILLIVPFIFGIITFAAPVWKIHRAMAAKQSEVARQLEQLSESISRLAQEMLADTESENFAQRDDKSKRLAWMRQVYENNSKYPVWPFDTYILTRFVTAQIVPLIGLAKLPATAFELIKNNLGLLSSK